MTTESSPGFAEFYEKLRVFMLEKVDSVAERLTLALSEGDKTIELSIHYGDRRATLTFER